MLWFWGSEYGCYVLSLILELGTLVLKAGPKVLQKRVFYLTPAGTPLLLQPPPASSGWRGAGARGDCGSAFSTMGRTAHTLAPLEPT